MVISGYVDFIEKKNSSLWLNSVIKNHTNYCLKYNYSYKFFTHYSKPASLNEKNLFYLGSWSKPEYILDELKTDQYDFIFWIDPDSIFSNFNISLSDLYLENKDLTFAGDYSDVFNGGHLMVKNSDFSKNFLSMWNQSRFINFSSHKDLIRFPLTQDGYALGDQSLFNALLNNPSIEPTSLVNSFNNINGFEGNDLKKYKNWGELFLSSKFSLENIYNNLIHKQLHKHIHIVPQKRLNSYLEYNHDKVKYSNGDPIIHFVSTSKKYLLKRNFIIYFLIEKGIFLKPLIFKIKELLRSTFNEHSK